MENVNIMKKLLNVVVVVLCVLMCMPIGASAASNVLMRYEGKNIYDKASIGTFELKRVTNIKINHQTLSWYKLQGRKTNDLYVRVDVQKKGLFFFSDSGNSFKKYSVGKTTKTFTEEKGTYKLYFTTNMFSANIKGSVTRK